jgi:hypothetical protein
VQQGSSSSCNCKRAAAGTDGEQITSPGCWHLLCRRAVCAARRLSMLDALQCVISKSRHRHTLVSWRKQ